jgi:hypothetical protein
MGGYPIEENMELRLKGTSYKGPFLAVPNCRNVTREITKVDELQHL